MIDKEPTNTETDSFFAGLCPDGLIEKYGSPLYVYNENILRTRCREMRDLISYKKYKPSFSAKANSNLALLKIIREEGLDADAMSPGEIYIEQMAGFEPDQIFFIGNNVSAEEMRFAAEKGVLVSVDSLSQLELYGRTNPGSRVAIRVNPGIGAGHHEKVITGGKNTKFGVNFEYLPQIRDILKKYSLTLAGLNSHIGSLFMEPSPYLDAAEAVAGFAANFKGLEFIDLGGGFGVPYMKGEKRLDLLDLSQKLTAFADKFTAEYGEIKIKTEPGRYVAAECGILLGTVHAIKNNGSIKYAGTDIGFNALTRPVIYGSYHEIEVYGKHAGPDRLEKITVVGNICETGDILAQDRLLPEIAEGDIIGMLNAGAYGYSMASNYNHRLRPAEVLLKSDGIDILIKARDTIEDLTRGFR